MNAWKDVAVLAARQHGVITAAQARELGLHPATLHRRAAAEGWARPQPGVIALPGSADTPERRIMAATLGVRHGAWASRWTAAYLWGLTDRLRVPVTVVVPHGHRAAPLDRAKVLRSRTLTPEDLTQRSGIPCVGVARMLADLAAVADVAVLRATAIDARQRGLLDVGQLLELWERIRPAPGHRHLWRVAAEFLEGGLSVDSVLEWRLRGLLRRLGLPEPYGAPYPVVVDGRVVASIDIAWPDRLVGIECDSFRHHSQRRQLDADSARQNRLAALGWRLLRVTWAHVEEEPDAVGAQVRRLLDAAGALTHEAGAN